MRGGTGTLAVSVIMTVTLIMTITGIHTSTTFDGSGGRCNR